MAGEKGGKYPRIRPFNGRSILVEFEPKITPSTLSEVLFVKNLIEIKYVKQKVEIINAYSSILIKYPIGIDKIYDEVLALKAVIQSPKSSKISTFNTWNIPVCYEAEFGFDLDALSCQLKLSKKEIIDLHSQTEYAVYFTGFLPGFLYLGGLHEKLQADRKATPNLNVKKGSVAIGGKQTGIYPEDSPGGWHIIGSTPIPFFDPQQQPPCFATAGDVVRFQTIDKDRYMELQNAFAIKTFNWETLLNDD